MGKRYVCDYCNKSMVATPAMIRTHNNGLIHQKLVREHYQQFKDPETILAEEGQKKRCTRFVNGECHFGNVCRYTHYNGAQMRALRELVASRSMPKDVIFPSFEELVHKLLDEKTNNKHQDSSNGTTVMYDGNGVTHVFPWTYNTILESYGENLPPSVKRLKIEDFTEAKIETWG